MAEEMVVLVSDGTALWFDFSVFKLSLAREPARVHQLPIAVWPVGVRQPAVGAPVRILYDLHSIRKGEKWWIRV